ncbi:DUF397 domain-containing protein [Catenuloplanes sp. NPDC051500]|uniref:DUF397 domain-containing protein n=1 Tax=Catenuloplanes sp. NPDC051500 TaxID=3363959 RepID=UPI0037AE1FC9
MDLSRAQWRKSRRSGGGGGNCVEIAGNLPGFVAFRDSKDPAGPILTVSTAAYRAFTAHLAGR